MPSEKAFLRLEYYAQSASMANEGNSAAHLLVYALNNITERTVRASDPRMKSLTSVAHLKSLQKGDISNYKWGGRQPVRRLAGDVHGDMTCIVLELSNPGKSPASIRQPSKTHAKCLLLTTDCCQVSFICGCSTIENRVQNHVSL